MAHRIAVGVCALALVATSSATAASPRTAGAFSQEAVQAARDIATDYWSARPCAGDVAISWLPLAPAINASSTWANAVGAYDAPQQNIACSIVFNSGLEWDWTRFCSILVHEYGHLSGHSHTNDADDVMYPYYVKPVAECQVAASAQPELTGSSAAVSTIPEAGQSPQRKAKRAVLVVVRTPHKLHRRSRGRQHRHRASGAPER